MTVSQPPTTKIPSKINNPTPAQINDPVVKMLNDQIAEALLHPEKALELIDLHSTRKFVFRTRPNTVRLLQLRIPGLPQSEAMKEEVGNRKNYGAEFQKIYTKRHTPEQAASYEDLVDRVGDIYITFTAIPQRHECFYETDDQVVADYIRGVIASGKQPHLYEDRGLQYVRSRYTDAIFPDTEAGRQQLYVNDLAYERAIKDHAAKSEALRQEAAALEAAKAADLGKKA